MKFLLKNRFYVLFMLSAIHHCSLGAEMFRGTLRVDGKWWFAFKSRFVSVVACHGHGDNSTKLIGK